MHFRYLLYITVFHNLCITLLQSGVTDLLLHPCPKARNYFSYLDPGLKMWRREEEMAGGTLTAWGLVVLVIWEEVVQSLFA